METSAIITIVISLVNQILKQLPDKEEREKIKKERKIKEWNDIVELYESETNKPLDVRDHDKILNIRDNLLLRAGEYK